MEMEDRTKSKHCCLSYISKYVKINSICIGFKLTFGHYANWVSMICSKFVAQNVINILNIIIADECYLLEKVCRFNGMTHMIHI